VRVREVACAGGRDPGPHLAEPEVVEDEDRVLVTVTSAEVRGGATCQTGPDVPVVVHLDEPLGERDLYDAGTWPPTPLDVAAPEPGSGAWTSVDRGWAVLDVPPGWTDLDCPDGWVDLGPADGCATETGVWLAESDATIDLCCPPGLSRDDDGRWSGYVHVGDGLVHVGGVDRPTALRLLGSVRLPGEDAVPVAEWERRETGGLRYEVPAGAAGAVQVTVTSNLALSARFPLRRVDAEQWGSGWRLTGDVGGWRVVIVAPSEALAELVAASVRRVS